jgi:hypothetical protein
MVRRAGIENAYELFPALGRRRSLRSVTVEQFGPPGAGVG